MRMSERRSTNVSLPTDLVANARALGINLSRACEDGLQAAIRAEASRRLRESLASEIAWLNSYYGRHEDGLAEYRDL
jgi:antitoxin CcdA